MADQVCTNSRPGRVILWMLPRTGSTAFVKCMSGIPGVEIWLEPFGFSEFASKYAKTSQNIDVPMEYEGNEQIFEKTAEIFDEITGRMGITPEMISCATLKKGLESATSKYVFVKDESLGMISHRHRQYLPVGYKHAFLIRHPYLVFASLRKATFQDHRDRGVLQEGEDESNFDLRKHNEMFEANRLFKDHYELWKYIHENIEPNPIVIDSNDVLSKPAEVVPKFCEAMGLPYSDDLLQWDGSLESTKKWKVCGRGLINDPTFVGVAMASTHFTPPKQPPPRDQLTEDVIALSDEAMPVYQEMYGKRLGATS